MTSPHPCDAGFFGEKMWKIFGDYKDFCNFATEIRFRYLGLTGLDSGLRWYVSTRRLLGSLHNLS